MMIAIALFIILGILTPAPAAGFRISKPCCTRYSDKAVAFKHIRGYREQISLEHCRINAIIFYTTSNHEVCARPEDEWVKKALDSLSAKLKMMSNNIVGEGL
ncbi:C-C motif chemokine 20 [Fundulus heteroclitus]|uniref:C-C motif chemokine 20 n=1 Tax=Fundulus heteroclitus TaxID=8078 RepID=A0A3Q2PX13_FUNHE|nr:C-C motif chemokine 20 [Fundulus heteroclitus]